jgi:hypothetical protein
VPFAVLVKGDRDAPEYWVQREYPSAASVYGPSGPQRRSARASSTMQRQPNATRGTVAVDI